MNYNKVVLVGRITRDPEIRKTQTQQIAYVMFTIAVNKKYQQDQTDFINCVAWDKRAEFLANYIKRGALLLIEGRLQTRKYEAQDGNRLIVEVVADEIQPLERNEQRTSSRQNIESLESTYSQSSSLTAPDIEFDATKDNIPF